RLRERGAGAKPLTEIQPGLLEALDELVNPETRGNPMSLLRWTSKSTAHLAKDLVRQGFRISDDTVGRLLKRLGYSLQAPAKQKEGTAHPDRDGQFRYLNETATAFVADVQPVISVDTKKKELVGEFANKGVEYQPVPTAVSKNQHRMFRSISLNYHGAQRESHKPTSELIGATKTAKDVSNKAERDTEWYPVGVKVRNTEIAAIPLDLRN